MPQWGQRFLSSFLSLSVLIACAAQLGCLQDAKAPSVERGIAVLITLLQDEHPDTRRTAAESLGKIGDRSALPAVLPLLTDPVPAVRATAVQALGRVATADDGAVIAGLAHLLDDSDERVRQAAALAIGEIEPSPRQLTPVADLLRASDVQIRRAAVRALISLDTAQVIEWLLPLLDDPDAEVRQGAVSALGFSGDARVTAALWKRLVHDPSPAVRAETAYHLGELSGQDTRPLLRAALEKETDHGVRRWIEAELKALRVND